MTQNTVYIIGAGASAELELPTGEKLKESISSMLSFKYNIFDWEGGDREILNALKSHCQQNSENIENYGKAANNIHEALPLAISIDNYIDNHRGNKEIELCGKLGIVKSILLAEKKSNIFIDRYGSNQKINFKSLGQTWYLQFFRSITENCAFEELEQRFKNITLIIFNYDRCLEHFLLHAIKEYYRKPPEEVKKVLDFITIFHPYGKVGRILSINENENVPFGADVDFVKLLELSTKIRTFTQSSEKDVEYLNSMRKRISEADKLIFLGFGFHELNMQLLDPASVEADHTPACYASMYGIEEDGQSRIRSRITQMFSGGFRLAKDRREFSNNINMRNAKCSDFFAYYNMSLKF